MECGKRRIKNLFHFFNFIFVLCGLAYLIIGVLALIGYNYLKNLDKDIPKHILPQLIVIIVFGSIIIFIAFLGCCGAIRESHCMLVTFAALLLTILIIQVIDVIYIFVTMKNSDEDNYKVYTTLFNNYRKEGRKFIDIIQETNECCGVDGPDDFTRLLHISIPGTCCGKSTYDTCDQKHSYKTGCIDVMKDKSEIILIVISIGIELINIIFTVCLVNSIKNAKRRGNFV